MILSITTFCHGWWMFHNVYTCQLRADIKGKKSYFSIHFYPDHHPERISFSCSDVTSLWRHCDVKNCRNKKNVQIKLFTVLSCIGIHAKQKCLKKDILQRKCRTQRDYIRTFTAVECIVLSRVHVLQASRECPLTECLQNMDWRSAHQALCGFLSRFVL